MKHLRIREYAHPLSDARKIDQRVETAAVFVERLFGRPLKSDPNVMVITPGNKTEIRDILRDEYPNAISVRLLWFLASDDHHKEAIWDLQQKYPDGDFTRINFADFRLDELRSPAKLILKILDTRADLTFRAIVEHLSQIDDPTFLQRIARAFMVGVYMYGPDMIVLSEKDMPGVLVHELIHAEDREEFGIRSGKFNLMVAEGRAKYGEKTFEAVNKEDAEPVRYLQDSSIFTYLKPLAESPGLALRRMRSEGARDFMKWMKSVYDVTIGHTGLSYQLVYLPFALQLIDLAIAVRSPFLAFQIATAKPPERLAHLFRSREYYAEEIALHRGKDESDEM